MYFSLRSRVLREDIKNTDVFQGRTLRVCIMRVYVRVTLGVMRDDKITGLFARHLHIRMRISWMLWLPACSLSPPVLNHLGYLRLFLLSAGARTAIIDKSSLPQVSKL